MADYVDVFDTLFLPKLGIRAPTFRAVIREAVTRGVKSIVETGCTRKADNWEGDGQSTIIWGHYVRYCHGAFQSIDLDETACELARELVPGVVVTQGDSAVALTKSASEIDLLYLDSYDVDMSSPHAAALHCMMEFASARPRLKSGSIVFVDDSPMNPDFTVAGKGTYLAQYFKQLGMIPFTFAYQAAWIMP